MLYNQLQQPNTGPNLFHFIQANTIQLVRKKVDLTKWNSRTWKYETEAIFLGYSKENKMKSWEFIT